MVYQVQLMIDPSELYDEELLRGKICQAAGIEPDELTGYHIDRRSIDARKKPKYLMQISAFTGSDQIHTPVPIRDSYKKVNDAEEVFIIGAGPAGYFAALKCIQLGLRPVVLDRGKDARSRRRDLRAIQQFSIVNPDSNYCFGEGGAGTYSDGKLYTRSKKRGNVREVLQILVEHGADPDILVDAHPHIGSNKLPGIISNIRSTIEEFGGQVLFNHRVIDLAIENRKVHKIYTSQGSFKVRQIILATGHSARDIYDLLRRRKVALEAKPFALGLRLEHPQSRIDRIQYGQDSRHPNLPAASYRLVCDLSPRGVFSFCMCPGGLIVPAATAPGEIVVNGMSLSRRDSPFANSGIVVAVGLEDVKRYGYEGDLACMAFQQSVERRMFESGDGSQKAPAQRLQDFLVSRNSGELPPSSYIPGIFPQRLDQLLPNDMYEHLRRAFVYFGKRMNDFISDDAVLVGVESRTSSPVRIPRDPVTLMHPYVGGLYPSGEGAGYAGGIVSAAIDGQQVATAVARYKNLVK